MRRGGEEAKIIGYWLLAIGDWLLAIGSDKKNEIVRQ